MISLFQLEEASKLYLLGSSLILLVSSQISESCLRSQFLLNDFVSIDTLDFDFRFQRFCFSDWGNRL